MRPSNRKPFSLIRRTLRWGLIASLLLHAGLLAVLMWGTVRGWIDQRPLREIQITSTHDQPPTSALDDASATVIVEEDDGAPSDFQHQFEDALAATEQMSEAERMESLDQAADRLNRISSEVAVDEVAKRLQSWLGLAPRAASPADASQPEAETVAPHEAAADGEFDFETAQLHDVKRVVVPDSRPKYVCVLLDAEGRTLEVPMSEAEGEPIYTVMKKIKASPLLEQIYRQVAMPLLDQIVKAETAAAAAAAEVRAESEAESATGPGGVAKDQQVIAPPLPARKVAPPEAGNPIVPR